MKQSVLDKIDSALNEDSSSEDTFKALEKSLNKILNKGVQKFKVASGLAVAYVNMDDYNSNQEHFETGKKEDWTVDQGYVLLSTMPDTDPQCMKLYFGELKEFS